MKIKPKDYRRSIEVLVREFPDKTAKEILELYEFDEKCFQMWVSERDAKLNEKAKWLMESKYIRISYGGSSNLIQYNEVIKAEVIEGRLYWSTITSSLSNVTVVRKDGFSIDTLREERQSDFGSAYTGNEKIEALTKEQYDNFHSKVLELFEL